MWVRLLSEYSGLAWLQLLYGIWCQSRRLQWKAIQWHLTRERSGKHCSVVNSLKSPLSHVKSLVPVYKQVADCLQKKKKGDEGRVYALSDIYRVNELDRISWAIIWRGPSSRSAYLAELLPPPPCPKRTNTIPRLFRGGEKGGWGGNAGSSFCSGWQDTSNLCPCFITESNTQIINTRLFLRLISFLVQSHFSLVNSLCTCGKGATLM